MGQIHFKKTFLSLNIHFYVYVSDCSENITINDLLLQRLIRALKNSSSPRNSPKRLRDEIQLLKEREKALEECLTKQMESPNRSPPKQEGQENPESGELNSMESLREDGEVKDSEETPLEIPPYLDSSTRPTTPNKSINIPNIQTPREALSIEDQRNQDLEIEEMKIYKKYYEELKVHMNANDEEIKQSCSKLTEQILQLELDLNRERKSFLYMREDFDKNLSALKTLEMQHIEKEGVMKLEMATLKEALQKLNQDLEYQKRVYIYNQEDYSALQQAFQQSQMQLAFLTQEILTGKLGANLKIPEMCMDYGIIQDDLQIHFMTQQEIENQTLMLKDFEGQRSDLQRKITQLESLLEIAQDQIGSQQRLLNDITDNHVNLRHLVADLQSSTEEKLLMAKMQRDLNEGKYMKQN